MIKKKVRIIFKSIYIAEKERIDYKGAAWVQFGDSGYTTSGGDSYATFYAFVETIELYARVNFTAFF